jgi:DNA polymerase III delta prime subunit
MRLSVALLSKKLIQIADTEKIKYQKEAIDQISDLAHGDMRTAVNMLQLIYNKKETIKSEFVNELCDLPQQIVIKKMFDHLLKNDLHSAITVLYELKNNGYSGSDITLGMMYTLKSDTCKDMPEDVKIKIFYCVCMAAYRISKGIDSILQLSSCLVDIIKAK